jgi:hypothetical protein
MIDEHNFVPFSRSEADAYKSSQAAELSLNAAILHGGSLENRSRFLLQVVEALASVWGGNRVAVRIAPGGR